MEEKQTVTPDTEEVSGKLTGTTSPYGVSGPALGRNGEPIDYEALKNLCLQQQAQIELFSRQYSKEQQEEFFKRLDYLMEIIKFDSTNPGKFSSTFMAKIFKGIEETFSMDEKEEVKEA